MDYCLSILLREIRRTGVQLFGYRLIRTKRQLREALKHHRLHMIMKDGDPIGFLTWSCKYSSLFINNLCIFKNCRNPANLLYLRRWFRSHCPDAKTGIWENRRRKKPFICH